MSGADGRGTGEAVSAGLREIAASNNMSTDSTINAIESGRNQVGAFTLGSDGRITNAPNKPN